MFRSAMGVADVMHGCMVVVFTLYIDPVAKGRPRLARNGQTFTPARTANYERAVVLAAKKHRISVPMSGPLYLSVEFGIPKPKSVPKKRIEPFVRPDLDNYLKAIMDGLKDFWYDDAQVCEIHTKKVYTDKGYARILISDEYGVVDQTND